MSPRPITWFSVLLLTAALMAVPSQSYGSLIGVGIGLYSLIKFRARPRWNR
jgi:hypothetical protein